MQQAWRCSIAVFQGREILEKRADGEVAQQALAHEARMLEQLAGLHVPELISFSPDRAVLRRAYVAGQPLSELRREYWTRVLDQVEEALVRVHAYGFVHGDLRPDNIIVSESAVSLIDWEHALHLGMVIDQVPHRAVTPGLSHPRLIWGHGVVDTDLDVYPIDQMRRRANEKDEYRASEKAPEKTTGPV
nr:phosphotransferase [Epibacterium ulvae]